VRKQQEKRTGHGSIRAHEKRRRSCYGAFFFIGMRAADLSFGAEIPMTLMI
jgi:hypothetical protein